MPETPDFEPSSLCLNPNFAGPAGSGGPGGPGGGATTLAVAFAPSGEHVMDIKSAIGGSGGAGGPGGISKDGTAGECGLTGETQG